MNRQEWMRTEIATWRQEGVIDDGLAATLLGRYAAADSKVSLGARIAGIFGALLNAKFAVDFFGE